MTFADIHELCSNGVIEQYLKSGDELVDEYTVVNVKPDSIKIRKNWINLTRTEDWKTITDLAKNYLGVWNTENTDLAVKAFKTELLTVNEVERLSAKQRLLGLPYWLSDLDHDCDCAHGIILDDGIVHYEYDFHRHACVPGIWVR